MCINTLAAILDILLLQFQAQLEKNTYNCRKLSTLILPQVQYFTYTK